MEKYDSTNDTLKHIDRVRQFIDYCQVELKLKGQNHDKDKILNQTEKALFDEYTPKLKNCTYGSEEYKGYLKGLQEGLCIHYANNRHHPEHFDDGIRGMNLLDLLEMICDWKAASERHADGNPFTSIELNQKRFGYSDDLKAILRNTVDFLIRRDNGVEEL